MNSEDGILRILLPLCLQYLDEFVQSELQSRKLAFFCCKKLGQFVGKVGLIVKDEGISSLVNQNVTNSVCNGTISNVPPAPSGNSNSNITPSNVAGNSNPSGSNNNSNSNNSNANNNQ